MTAELAAIESLILSLQNQLSESNESISALEERVRELEKRLTDLAEEIDEDPDDGVPDNGVPDNGEDTNDDEEETTGKTPIDSDNGSDDDSDMNRDTEAETDRDLKDSQTVEDGKPLPKTGVATSIIGLAGVLIILSGMGLHFFSKRN